MAAEWDAGVWGRRPQRRGLGRVDEAVLCGEVGTEMQMRFFAIAALDPGGAEEEPDRFLRGHRAVTVHKQTVRPQDWAF